MVACRPTFPPFFLSQKCCGLLYHVISVLHASSSHLPYVMKSHPSIQITRRTPPIHNKGKRQEDRRPLYLRRQKKNSFLHSRPRSIAKASVTITTSWITSLPLLLPLLSSYLPPNNEIFHKSGTRQELLLQNTPSRRYK